MNYYLLLLLMMMNELTEQQIFLHQQVKNMFVL